MKAGTTYALGVKLGVDLTLVDQVIFSFANAADKTVVLTKTFAPNGEQSEDFVVIDGVVYIGLHQSETTALLGTYALEAQINFTDKSVAKTQIMEGFSCATLATEEVDGNTPNTDMVDIIEADIAGGVIFIEGKNGATFIPAVSESGVISWTNNKSLPNPDPVDIRGPQGPQGPQGETGATGPQGAKGDTGAVYTPMVSVAGVVSWSNDGGLPNPEAVDITAAVLAALPSAVGVEF